KVVKPMSDQFYGDRAGTLEDPFGHTWTVATHKEDLTSEEILQRAAARSGKSVQPAPTPPRSPPRCGSLTLAAVESSSVNFRSTKGQKSTRLGMDVAFSDQAR